MNPDPRMLVQMVVAIGFAAGLNVYATILALGISARMGWVELPSGLGEVSHTWVLVAAGVLFAAEFVADKIPGFDLVWNAAHTFIRLPLAALLAYGASTHMTAGQQAVVTLLGAAVAALAHGTKLVARVAVTPSPEPVSNVGLSLVEDAGAVGLTWVATQHPAVACAVVGVTCLLGVGMTVVVWKAVRGWWRRARAGKGGRRQILAE